MIQTSKLDRAKQGIRDRETSNHFEMNRKNTYA